MMNKAIIASWLLLATLFQATGQQQSFDKLLLPAIPAGWSKQEQTDRVVYSNYNLQGTIPLTVTVFRSVPLQAKPEQSFARLWRQCLQLADTATAPKPRRQYTFDGDAVATAAMEQDGPLGKGYYQLFLYGAANWQQAILLFTTSAKVYKTQFTEWPEWLQSVRLIKDSNKG
jgi:hypothetical protein